MRELIEWFKEDLPPDSNFNDLKQRLEKETFVFDSYLGLASRPNDVNRATEILSSGKRRIIGAHIGGSVGGFLFNPYHPSSVNEIVRIKSVGGTKRQELFSMVINAQTVNEITVPGNIDRIRWTDAAGACFIQFPIPEEATRLIPEQFYHRDEEKELIFAQCFIAGEGSMFDTLITQTTGSYKVPFLGGTSANYSGWGSIETRLGAARFSLGNAIYFLDDDVPSSHTLRGSYTIIRIVANIPELVRNGNIGYDTLVSRLIS